MDGRPGMASINILWAVPLLRKTALQSSVCVSLSRRCWQSDSFITRPSRMPHLLFYFIFPDHPPVSTTSHLFTPTPIYIYIFYILPFTVNFFWFYYYIPGTPTCFLVYSVIPFILSPVSSYSLSPFLHPLPTSQTSGVPVHLLFPIFRSRGFCCSSHLCPVRGHHHSQVWPLRTFFQFSAVFLRLCLTVCVCVWHHPGEHSCSLTIRFLSSFSHHLLPTPSTHI